MRVSRFELFRMIGIPETSVAPLSIVMGDDEGARQASIKWIGDEFGADLSECYSGDASEVIVLLEGVYHSADDEFDLTARDRDSFGAEDDVARIASKFGRQSQGMQKL